MSSEAIRCMRCQYSKASRYSGDKIQITARITTPSRGPIGLCRIHAVHRGDLPVLRRPPRLLRRVWVHADLLLPKLQQPSASLDLLPVTKLVVHEFVISTSAEKGPACLSAVI